jgi:hypothetical protein
MRLHAQQVPPMGLALLIVAALVGAIPALAHSWYPLACCGSMDCFPVACDQLVETGSGWFYQRWPKAKITLRQGARVVEKNWL